MRILQVFKDYYPPTRGGIEQHIHEIVRSNTQFLRQAGFGGHAVESAYDVLPNGIRVDKFMRSLCREALRSAELGDGDPPPDPFDPAEVEAFMGWLSAPAGGPRARPLSCYLLEVHRANPYLQSAFRLTSGPEVDAYVEWIIRWGSFEHQIPDPLVPQAQPARLTFDPEWARI